MSNVVFAIVVDGEVAGTLVYPDDTQRPDIVSRHIAALQSDPKIVPVVGQTVELGWIYNGTEFIPPTL